MPMLVYSTVHGLEIELHLHMNEREAELEEERVVIERSTTPEEKNNLMIKDSFQFAQLTDYEYGMGREIDREQQKKRYSPNRITYSFRIRIYKYIDRFLFVSCVCCGHR